MRDLQGDVQAVRRLGPRINFVAFDSGGAGHHRSFYPARELSKRGWDVSAQVGYPDESAELELMIVHRPLPGERRLHRSWRARGTKIIVSEDDDLRSIPDTFDPAHVPPEWMLQLHERMISEADALVVTTRTLANVYGPLAKRTFICHNWLPIETSWLAHTMKSEWLRVGWQGIMRTHRCDVEWLAPEARRALEGVMLTLVGDPGVVPAWAPPSAVEVFQYETDQHNLYQLMARADVGMVPLDPSRPINVSKSWLKQLEYTMLGIPCVVVGDLPEQLELAQLTGAALIASTPATFADAVQQLVHDANLREQMAESARAAREQLSWEANVSEWETVFAEVLS